MAMLDALGRRRPVLSNLSGQRFGQLTVLTEAPRGRPKPPNQPLGARRWNCRCDCGAETVIEHGNLRSGHTTRCLACADRARGRERLGLSRKPEYQIWAGIKRRCFNPHQEAYANYGARGIGMSDEWRDSFAAFYRDMGPRPAGTSIERVDNTKGYYKENCRWATATEQSRNRRSTVRITHDGLSLTATEWAQLTGLAYGTILRRVKAGLAPGEIVNRRRRAGGPADPRKKVARRCELCGKRIVIYRTKVQRGRGVFCGKRCAGRVSANRRWHGNRTVQQLAFV